MCRFSCRIRNQSRVSKVIDDVGFCDGNSVKTVPKPVKTVLGPFYLSCSAVFE